MQLPLIIANWKSNMIQGEASSWVEAMNKPLSETQKTVVVCPPYTLLPFLKTKGLVLGAQDISPFGMGAYTGSINGEQIKEFAEYVLIGHSERREYFKETDEILAQKVKKAQEVSLTVIFCVQGVETPVPKGVDIVAYEPIWAIGTGEAQSPEQANEVAKTIKKQSDVSHVLYGGSVTAENVTSFTKTSHISGVLVGGSSLNSAEFFKIIHNA